jgi:hypothetical protein
MGTGDLKAQGSNFVGGLRISGTGEYHDNGSNSWTK